MLGVALGEAMTTAAQAGLTLNMVCGTGSPNAVAIDANTTTVHVEFWANVTGTNETTTDDGLNGFYASFYTTKYTDTTNKYALSKGNLSWTRGPDMTAVKWPGLATQDPVQKDLDLDGDLDLGSTIISLAANWMGVDAGVNQNPPPFYPYVLGLQHLGTVVYTQSSFNPSSHGVTQIYAKNRRTTTTFVEMDGVEKTVAQDTANSLRATLYVTGTADAGPDQFFVTAPDQITLTGAGSVGSMNHWIWDISLDGGTTWNRLADSSTDTLTLPWSQLGITRESVFPVPVHLTTEYTGAGILNDNISTDTILITPEPATLSLLAVGGLLALRRRRK
jgi:hypothetical protein